MAGNFIPFALPDIGEEEINEVVDSLRNGWLTTGPKTQKFESDFKNYIGCEHALAVNSATSGLHLALEAIGLQRGDKVIVPVNTFTATAEVVRYFEADPIFCDIDARTFNIDPKQIEQILITHPDRNKIKAIIPVHIAGQPCDMEKILHVAKSRDLFVIEDAAHAFPAKWNGKNIGCVGDITVFSFYATKTLSTAEGGMITTNNQKFAERMKVMRLHGFDRDMWDRNISDKPKWYYSVVAPGFKYNMNDLSASMGIHQLAKADQFLKRRTEIAHKYSKAFKNLSIPFIERPSDTHSHHLYILKVKNRDRFIERMSEEGIGTSVHFIPLHLQPYWKEKYQLQDQDFPVALNNFKEIVSLPIYTKLSNEDVSRIIETVLKITNEL